MPCTGIPISRDEFEAFKVGTERAQRKRDAAAWGGAAGSTDDDDDAWEMVIDLTGAAGA